MARPSDRDFVDSINVAARYGTPSPAQASGDASASILRKAIDTAANSASQLIASMPDGADIAAAAAPQGDTALPPIGNVGHRLDIRM